MPEVLPAPAMSLRGLMRRNTRRRSTTARRAIGSAAALAIGAGGLVAVNIYASADETSAPKGTAQNQALAAGTSTIDCPDVGQQLTSVPAKAKAQVDKELALLDKQISEAYQRLSTSQKAIQQDPNFAQNAIVGPLKDKRKATIDRIAIAIGRVAAKPQGLDALAACTLRATGNQGGNDTNAGGTGNGPVAADFVDITKVKANVRTPARSAKASRVSSSASAG